MVPSSMQVAVDGASGVYGTSMKNLRKDSYILHMAADRVYCIFDGR